MNKNEIEKEMNRYWRTLAVSVFIGLAVGCIVALYRIAISFAADNTDLLYQSAFRNFPAMIVLLAVLLLIMFVVGYLTNNIRYIGGSGIPQVQYILKNSLPIDAWFALLLTKFTGGCLCLAAGLSLGREGPCVQMGGWLGYGLNTLLGRFKVSEKVVICCGAGAGLAAAFSAPLAGVMFVLEELRKIISPIILLSTLLAALVADAVVQKIFGMKPVMAFAEFTPPPFTDYAGFIFVGIMTGVVGVLFNKYLLLSLRLLEKVTVYKRLAGVLILCVAIAYFYPQLLGGRDGLVNDLTLGLPTLKIIILFLFIKFVFTVISYGSGVPGGIFLPLLMIGALVGAVCVSILSLLGMHAVPEVLIVVAMAGCFTSIVKAPVTGMILIAEMTASFTCFMPVAVVCTVAMLVSDALGGKPIYELLLERMENSIH